MNFESTDLLDTMGGIFFLQKFFPVQLEGTRLLSEVYVVRKTERRANILA